MNRRPAILGGRPAFVDELPFARPFTPPLDTVADRLRPSYDRGLLTNGVLVRQLEEAVAARLGARHTVAVASCTAGLILVIQALRPGGDVVVPSFTFSASAHAIVWNGRRPRFAECDPDTFQLDVGDARNQLAGAGAVVATHVFGAPCAAERVVEEASAVGVPVVFDAAHAFGAARQGRPIGMFGDAEVFSLSPTKPLVAGEGGLVVTERDDVAEHVRLGRDYGNPGDYDTAFAGLNARMSELHAAVALESLARLDESLERRRKLAACYTAGLADVPGIGVQRVDPGDESTFKDFTVTVDPDAFGIGRDVLARSLRAEGVDTRRYFSPPVHRQRSYAGLASDALPTTDALAATVLSLPIYPGMAEDAVEAVVEVIASVHDHAEEIIRARV